MDKDTEIVKEFGDKVVVKRTLTLNLFELFLILFFIVTIMNLFITIIHNILF